MNFLQNVRITIKTLIKGNIKYAISTNPGKSGTFICIDKIIDIHIAGEENYNIGRFTTPDFVTSVEMWAKKMNSGSF